MTYGHMLGIFVNSRKVFNYGNLIMVFNFNYGKFQTFTLVERFL